MGEGIATSSIMVPEEQQSILIMLTEIFISILGGIVGTAILYIYWFLFAAIYECLENKEYDNIVGVFFLLIAYTFLLTIVTFIIEVP